MRSLAWGRDIGRRDLSWAALLAVVAMGIALAYRSALVPTDPWHYVQGALAFPEGTWRPSGLSRWGFLLPIIPFARIWGDATATYYVVPLLSTGVLAAVLYLLGTRYVSRSTGVLAAAFALGTPLVFVNLTRGYTDLTATTLIGLALLLATLAADAAEDAHEAGRAWGWRVPALLAACGFVTGWSFEVRETAIFAWPVIGWVLWRIGRPLTTLAWFAPPALAWLVLDMLLCAVVYDDPWLKFRIILGADISESEVSSDAVYVGQSRWWYMTVLPRSILEISGGPALLACLAVGAVGGLVFRAQLGRIWAWGMLTVALLWIQGGALDPGHPSVRLDVARYWLSFIVPLMLAAVGTMAIVIRSSRGAWRGGAVLGGALLALGVLVPAVRFATTYPGFAPNGGDAMVELRDHLTVAGGHARHPGLGRLGHPADPAGVPDQPVRSPALGGAQLPLAQPTAQVPPGLGRRLPAAGRVRGDLQRRGPHLLALPSGAATRGGGVRPVPRARLGGAVLLLDREPHALPAGSRGRMAARHGRWSGRFGGRGRGRGRPRALSGSARGPAAARRLLVHPS